MGNHCTAYFTSMCVYILDTRSLWLLLCSGFNLYIAARLHSLRREYPKQLACLPSFAFG